MSETLPAQVHIVVAEAVDLPEILQLYQLAGLDSDKKLDLAGAQSRFERMRAYPDYKLYVAKSAHRIEGSFALLIMDNLGHHGTPAGIVEAVAVHPAMQRQGIGKAMMEYARDKCRAAGCYKMALSSNLKREAAHRFYDSLGFTRHGYSFLLDLVS